MSRIGSKPIKIPSDVTVQIVERTVTVVGPKGTLTLTFRPEVSVKEISGEILLERISETPKAKALFGLTRTLIANMVFGVTQGWNKGLELSGVGYRAVLEGNTLVLSVGFSHQVRVDAPEGINFEVVENKINVKGINKELVGETAARIRRVRPPEPYKGKGIKYVGEVIRRKAGKAAKAAGAPAGAK